MNGSFRILFRHLVFGLGLFVYYYGCLGIVSDFQSPMIMGLCFVGGVMSRPAMPCWVRLTPPGLALTYFCLSPSWSAGGAVGFSLAANGLLIGGSIKAVPPLQLAL